MSGKNTYDPRSAFDDRKLSENELTTKRELEIEEKVKPHLKEAFKKLKKEVSKTDK